jgi:hypothetical protein
MLQRRVYLWLAGLAFLVQPVFAAGARTQPTPLETAKVSLDGFGPVRYGMTPAEVQQALAVTLTRDEAGSDGCFYMSVEGDPGVSFIIENTHVERVDIDDAHHFTATGIKVGDTEKRAQAAYAGQIEVSDHTYVEGGHYLVVHSKDRKRALVIETDGRYVTRIRAGLEPAAEYVEGCE